jgi:putative oxidoreductase
MFDALLKHTLVPLVLRLGLAVIFVFHGLGKITPPEKDWGAAWAIGMPDAPATPVQLAVAWGELIGGIALALGFLTRLAAAGLAVIMAGAIATVHGPKGFSLAQGGYEYNFAILVMCAALILGGGGPLGLDRFVRVRRRSGRS